MKTVYKVVRQELKEHIAGLTGVLILTMSNVGLEALSPWPFKFLIDNVLGDEPLPFPLLFHNKALFGVFVVFIFFLTNILLNVIEYLHSTTLSSVIKRLVFSFSKSAFRNIEKLDIGFYRTQEIGDFIYKLEADASALGALIEDGFLPIISSSVFVIVTTAILLFINVKLTILSLLAMPFLTLGLYFFNKRIGVMSKRSERKNSQVFSFIQDALSQLKIIQAFTQESTQAVRFNQKIKTSLDTEYQLNKLNFLLSLVVGFIIALSYSIIIGVGISLVFRDEMTTGSLVIFIFYLDNLTNPLVSIIYAFSSIKENRIRIENMNVFFNKKLQAVETGIIRIPDETSIQFDHVSFESREGTKILDDVSFTIPEGKLTVIVGVSGSGKTSVISLIPRLINKPTSGKILFGGQNIEEYNPQALRLMISLVPQENTLFDETVREIISFGDMTATDRQVEAAARLAVADKFIEKLPGKYHFKVGEEGIFLSGGQRQRLSIARAFLKRPSVYIFDEPLSSLDLQTRKEVWENILKVTKGKTTIIVSNVLDVITEADQVITMNAGKVVHSGKYRDLHSPSNLYNLTIREE